jgi:hypothetical protein
LVEFKRQLSELTLLNESWMHDHLLLRFLRARRFDLIKTMLMFQKFLKVGDGWAGPDGMRRRPWSAPAHLFTHRFSSLANPSAL